MERCCSPVPEEQDTVDQTLHSPNRGERDGERDSLDGKNFADIGGPFTMAYGLITFQGIRYSLFSYNTRPDADSGFADFDSIEVREPHPRGLKKPIPYGRRIVLSTHDHVPRLHIANSTDSLFAAEKSPASFRVINRGLGRVALESPAGFVSVSAAGSVSHGAGGSVSLRRSRPGQAETFQWIETFTGELTLMSLATNRYLRVDFPTGALSASSPGPRPDGKDGVRFDWAEVSPEQTGDGAGRVR